MANTGDNNEQIIAWASKRPKWEKYIWKKCLEHSSMSQEDFDDCYQIFLLENGLSKENNMDLPEISLGGLIPQGENPALPIRLKSIQACENVNAIPHNQGINFHENLTIIYGRNGTGKSGYGRLLAEACFSRGKRNLLPNAREQKLNPPIKAKFVFDSKEEVEFTYGETVDNRLKRFSAFDEKSVHIYLDRGNSLNFVPGQLKVFDLVYGSIPEIEVRFNNDLTSQKIDNPAELLFQSGSESTISSFLMDLNEYTTAEELREKIHFDVVDQEKLDKLEGERSDLQKGGDTGKVRTEIKEKISALKTYKSRFLEFVNLISIERIHSINKHADEYQQKKRLVEELGTKQFDSGLLKTVGSEKWKALIVAAKELYEAEKGQGNIPDHCMLCNQQLNEKEKTLFGAYWDFLKGDAESEFENARQNLGKDYHFLESLKTKIPDSDSQNRAISILESDSGNFAEKLIRELDKTEKIIAGWIESVAQVDRIAPHLLHEFDLQPLDSLIFQYEERINKLDNSFSEVKSLDKDILNLKHLKQAYLNKEKILAYHEYLIWQAKARKVAFPKNKYTTTRKKFFIEIITEEYTRIFNEESKALDCPAGIALATKGKSGDTELKLNLEYSNHSLSDILSEGEQKVTALADFLTEVRMNKNNCGIILDDPVTSLDHERKKAIAERLVRESKNRQVIIFTHDIVFTQEMVASAFDEEVQRSQHWIKKASGVVGLVEENSSPRLSNLAFLKNKSQKELAGFREMTESQKENALSVACNDLRSACEALVREKLFCNSIERYADRVSMQVLEEMPLSRDLINKVVELHGRISRIGLMHDRSDMMRENPVDRRELDKALEDFTTLEKELDKERQVARDERKKMAKSRKEKTLGWL